MKNMLILATDYPNNEGKVSLMYIHTRSLGYKELGNNVIVLNFSTDKNYFIDGIKVISLKDYENNCDMFKDYLLICHAANLRYHYKFIKKNGKKFNDIVFFYHGHEVLKINKVYSKPYFYNKKNPIICILQNIYDNYKFKVWRKFLKKNQQKVHLIFVSNWMKNEFEKWVTPTKDFDISVTYNSVGKTFELSTFDMNCSKIYDFITIRSFIDGSKYCVDLVNEIAKKHPDKKFCLIGKGKYFNYFEKAPNIEFIEKNMNHDEIIKYLNLSKIALMPTRTDAQGLMACEIATTGMPLITSNLEVCHEVFSSFKNIIYIDNNDIINYNYSEALEKKFEIEKNTKYYANNTIKKELEFIERI